MLRPTLSHARSLRSPNGHFVGLGLAALVAAGGLGACSDDPSTGADAAVSADASTADAGLPDAAALRPYAHIAPPTGEVPAVLTASVWRQHYLEDIRGYWMTPVAWGTPEGNFPTYRGMDGSLQLPSTRYPRMIARQTYGYAMGYLLTGEPRLLTLAHAGMEWLRTKARDGRGGCHAQLTETGAPIEGPKTAQDLAYCALGFAAYYFVTRDPVAEAELLALRDTLMDPATYYDTANRRIRDGRSADLSAEYDVEGDGGWELVAQLDAINAFMLLSQPVLHEEARRTQLLGDLRVLSQTLIDTFWQDGIFWGVHTKKGQYGSRHADYGHTLKSYWMLLQVDKRLDDRPFQAFLEQHVRKWSEHALDPFNGRWASRPVDADVSAYGSDWWIYAEADQLAATLDMGGAGYARTRAQTQQHWLEDFVDRGSPLREIIPSIRREGSRAYPWSPTDTAKCNQWKSAFHSVEHALVLTIAGHWAEDTPLTLHFAVPAAEAETFRARPYLFDGRELSRTRGATLAVGGGTLEQVRVEFVELY